MTCAIVHECTVRNSNTAGETVKIHLKRSKHSYRKFPMARCTTNGVNEIKIALRWYKTPNHLPHCIWGIAKLSPRSTSWTLEAEKSLRQSAKLHF